MRRAVVGVIGHVDHGKTALVGALTGIDTDRLPEEKARGISIAPGFAHLVHGGGVVDLIDMPGHERFVAAMVGGASGIDAVLLVVAADAGVMPQTREHVGIAGLLGLQRAVVAVSRCDLADGAAGGAAAAELLVQAGLAVDAVVMTSARTGAGMPHLAAALAELECSARGDGGLPFLPIDRAFTIAGHGSVVTGTLRGGALAVGDRLELFPARRHVRVRGLEVHGAPVADAAPGQRVAVNLRGVAIADLARGMVLAGPDALEPSEWLTVDLRALAGAPPLKNGMALAALAGSDAASARVRLLDREVLAPGERCLAQVRLARWMTAVAGEAVILRLPAPVGTVAGGRVIVPAGARLRRHDPAVLGWLGALAELSAEGVVGAVVARGATSLGELARLSGLGGARLRGVLAGMAVRVEAGGAVIPEGAVIAGAARRRTLAPRPDPARIAAQAAVAEALGERLRMAGLQPRLPAELMADAAERAAVESLLRAGALVRCEDKAKGKVMLFHRDAIALAEAALAPLLGEGMAVGAICAALGISRKFAMPLLPQLDAKGFTRRCGDLRVLRERDGR